LLNSKLNGRKLGFNTLLSYATCNKTYCTTPTAYLLSPISSVVAAKWATYVALVYCKFQNVLILFFSVPGRACYDAGRFRVFDDISAASRLWINRLYVFDNVLRHWMVSSCQWMVWTNHKSKFQNYD